MILKKRKLLPGFIISLFSFSVPVVYLYATDYVPLAELPGIPPINPENPSSLGVYLNAAIPLFIGICAVLAVIMIVIGGIQYMGSEAYSTKGAAKERMKNAILGLLLALAAALILITINPDILNTDLGSLSIIEPVENNQSK